MPTFLWLLLGSFGLMCAMTIIIASGTRFYQRRFPDSQPVYFVGGFLLTAVCFVLSAHSAFFHDLLMPVLGLFIGACALLLVQIRTEGIKKELFFFLISLLSTLCLPIKLPLFHQLPAVGVYFLSGVTLYLIIRIFSIMDRVPWLSLLTLLTQGIFILFLIQIKVIPAFLMFPLFLALVAAITVAETVKVYTGLLVLGEYAALVSGYILGILWIFILANGYWLAPVIIFSYDIFELAVSTFFSCVAARSLYRPTVPFLIEQAFATNLRPKKLVRSLFFFLLFSALLAFVSTSPEMIKSIIGMEALLLVFIYYRLRQWGAPQVRLRDIGRDIKDGLVELKKQLTYIPLKKDKVQTESSKQDEALQKEPLKKEPASKRTPPKVVHKKSKGRKK